MRSPGLGLGLAAAAAVAVVAACDTSATLSFSLVFPPGQTRLPAEATKVRLTLDLAAGSAQADADVDADGRFEVALDLPAQLGDATLTLAAFDAAGATVAIGRSPPVRVNGYTNHFTIYVSPPRTFAEAPVGLAAGRTQVAVCALPFGAVLAGGALPSGAGTRNLRIYNAYSHEFQVGQPMPAARVGQVAFATADGMLFLFGGTTEASGTITDGELWAFDTTAAPAGSYAELPGAPALALAIGPTQAARLGDGRYVVATAGLPIVDPVDRVVTRAAPGDLDGSGTTSATALGDGRVVIAGNEQTMLVSADGSEVTTADIRISGHAAVALPGGGVLFVGGTRKGTPSTDALGFLADGMPFGLNHFLARPRLFPAAVVAGGEIVVIGGSDPTTGQSHEDAEIFDAATLEPIAEVPLVRARGTGVTAVVLPNDAVLVVGGEPTGTLEIYPAGRVAGPRSTRHRVTHTTSS